MKLRKILALALAACLAVTTLAGCTGAPTAASGDEVTVNLGSEPPEMNSITTTSTGSMNVLRHMMDGLVYLDQTDTPVPAVAESWEITNDGKTYTFKLRQDVKWSNGDPVTAKDFVFAWNQLFTAANAAQYATTWGAYIKGAMDMVTKGTPAEGVGYKAIDDYTLELNLEIPCTYILSILAFPNFYPINEKAYTKIGGLDMYGKEAAAFVTNGAFKIESWAHEDSIVLTKNPEYYDAANIKLDKINMLMIADTTTSYSSFVAGEMDMIGLTADQVDMATADGKEAQISYYNDASCWYFEFGVSKNPILANVNIRKAFTYGVDPQVFVDTLVKANSTVANSFTPPAVKQGEFTAAVGNIMEREANAANDYAGAKKLLEKGLKELKMTAADLDLTLIADDGDTAQKNCAFFQEQWKKNLGVEVAVQQMTYKQRLARMQAGDFDIVMAGWGPDYNDPMTFMDLWITGSGNNHGGWSNAEYDALIKAAYADGNPETRTATLIEAEKLLMKEMPIGPIYNRSKPYIVSTKLQGLVRTGFDDLNLRWSSVAK